MCYNENSLEITNYFVLIEKKCRIYVHPIVKKLTLRELRGNMILEEGATYDGSPDIIR